MSVATKEPPLKIPSDIRPKKAAEAPAPSPWMLPYMWAIGIIALALEIFLIMTTVPLDRLDTLIFSNNLINPELVAVVVMILVGYVCNYSVFFVPPNLYLTMSMTIYLAAFLIYPASTAAFITIIPAFLVELVILKRGFGYAIRTMGMYILSVLAASWVFNLVLSLFNEQQMQAGDLTGGQILAAVSGFIAFRIVNELVLFINQHLQRLNAWQLWRERFVNVTLTYAAVLIASLLLALIKREVGIYAFLLACFLVVAVAIVLKQLTEISKNERQQLETVQDLNAALARQSERQIVLGNQINTTLASFLALVRDYASTSHEQEAAVVEITATVEQLSRTAAQIAESSNKVSNEAKQTIETTGRGQQAVTETINAIDDVREKVQEIAHKILDLNQKSERIGEIITTINGIAGEIRMLALNATIEASGAGPFGRRFAVVAGEVNDLADKSRRAALEIRDIVVEIQAATTNSVRVTEEGLQRMERSVSAATQSELANREIISMVERTAQAAAAISLATQQQRSASEQVVSSMHDVALMISQNAEKIASVSVASLELQRVARELKAEE